LLTTKPGAKQNDPDQVAKDDDEIESFHVSFDRINRIVNRVKLPF
jgi:hypothetical protein